MYKLISLIVTILLLPIILPIAIYAGIMYNWQDTVPSPEDDI